MHVLQPRHDLRFRVEAANELRSVGIAGQNDLDGDFAADGGLIGPINRTETASSDAFRETVSFEDRPLWCLQVLSPSPLVSISRTHHRVNSPTPSKVHTSSHPALPAEGERWDGAVIPCHLYSFLMCLSKPPPAKGGKVSLPVIRM